LNRAHRIVRPMVDWNDFIVRTGRRAFRGEPLTDYHNALEFMASWSGFYNDKRSHSALKVLCRVDHCRGDPAARLAARQMKLDQALEARKQYWRAYVNVKEPQSLSLA